MTTERPVSTRKRSSRNDKPDLPDTLVAAEHHANELLYNRLLLGTLSLDKLRDKDEEVGFIQLSPRSPRGSGGGYSALRQTRDVIVDAK
jgi:hypothetical protein